jgi:hypothetical protein
MKHEEHKHSVEASSEVELSAGELLELSRPAEDELSQAFTDFALSGQQADAVSASSPTMFMQRMLPSWATQLSGARAMGIVGLAIVVSIAVGAHYGHAESKRAAQSATLPWTPIPERPETADVAIEIEELPAPEPTRFRNPFDKTEVFELAPGLSQDEARAIVADLLIERARERNVR